MSGDRTAEGSGGEGGGRGRGGEAGAARTEKAMQADS